MVIKFTLYKNKTRVFATNSIGFLPEVDLIVVMNNGKIEATGTYEEIIRVKGMYFDFLREHSNNPEALVSYAGLNFFVYHV